jgi:hypothetical protein
VGNTPHAQIVLEKRTYRYGEPIIFGVIVHNPLPNSVEVNKIELDRPNKDVLEFVVTKGNLSELDWRGPRRKPRGGWPRSDGGSRLGAWFEIAAGKDYLTQYRLQNFFIQPEPGSYRVTCKFELRYTGGVSSAGIRQYLPSVVASWLSPETEVEITGSGDLEFTVE